MAKGGGSELVSSEGLYELKLRSEISALKVLRRCHQLGRNYPRFLSWQGKIAQLNLMSCRFWGLFRELSNRVHRCYVDISSWHYP